MLANFTPFAAALPLDASYLQAFYCWLFAEKFSHFILLTFHPLYIFAVEDRINPRISNKYYYSILYIAKTD